MKKIDLILASLSLIVSTSTFANKDYYIGAGIGIGDLAGASIPSYIKSGTNYDRSVSTLTGRINTGYNFNNGWGIEFGYNFFADTKTNINALNSSASAKIFDLLAIYKLPIPNTKFAMDFGGGLAYKKVFCGFNYYNKTATSSSIASMLGVDYELTSNVNITGQYRHWAAGTEGNGWASYRIDAVLLGLSYSF